MKNSYRRIGSAISLAMAFASYGCSGGNIFEDKEEPGEENVALADDGASYTDETTEGFKDAPAIPADMEIIFEDDFVNSTGIPDPSKWKLCERTSNDATDWTRYLSGSYDQAYTQDGSLYILGERIDGEYKTGGIESKGKFEFQYGRLECRARFVSMPKGSHYSIWLMPSPPAQSWPKSGELDIMEHINKEEKIYQTIHSWYADELNHTEDPKAQGVAFINNSDWNIYGLEWSAEELCFTVNGNKYLSYPNLKLSGEDGFYQWPFDHPFYIILSQSLGGAWEGPVDNAELPAIFEIDWIRVMQPKNPDAGVPMITND